MKKTHAKAKACKSGKRATCIAQKSSRTFPAPIAESRITWGRALRALHRQDSATARKLCGVERAAWQVALAKARFLRDGTAYLTGADGTRLTRVEAGKRLVVKVATREGTGRAVEWQALAEMHAAARAELIAARLAGRDGMTEANRAANAELHHTARERVFASAHKAELATAHAHAIDRAGDLQGCVPWGWHEPHAAEFLAAASDQSVTDPRAIVRDATKRAARALRAFYVVKKYPRARKDHARDLRSLRANARNIASGEVARAAWRDDKAASERARDLGLRVLAGMELIAREEHPAPVARTPRPSPPRHFRTMEMNCAPDPMLAEVSARREVVTVERDGCGLGYPAQRSVRVIHSAQIVRLKITPLADRLTSRATRAEVATLADWKPAMQ